MKSKPKWTPIQVSKSKKPLDIPESLEAVGADGILDDADLFDLRAGTRRVALLMADGAWHGADEIRIAAGKPGCPASEGLRRARDLRKIKGVSLERRKRDGTRLFEYRIVKET